MVGEQLFKTDVLIIGGGAAGAFAAIKACENGAQNVLLIEKARTGKSGASCFAAGQLVIFIPNEDDRDLWMREYVEQGQYLNDQDWLQIFMDESFDKVKDLENWGLMVRKTIDGKYERVKGRGSHPDKGLRNIVFTGQAGALTEVLRKRAVSLGVKIINWTMVTDLLTKDGRAVGAAGFNTRSGEFMIFQAKATVIASGSGMFRCAPNIGHRMNNYEATGIAYRAGAELINCDFTTHLPFCGEFKMGGMQMTVGLGGKLVNAMNENFMDEYDPIYKESTSRFILSNAPLMEVRGGRGPIYMDLTHLPPDKIERWGSVLPLNKMILERAGVLVNNCVTRKLEWSMQGPSMGVFSAGIRINTRCETNLPGLFAAGDAAAKMPSGTSDNAGNLTFAFVSGARAGKFAADFVKHNSGMDFDPAQVKDLEQSAMGPLRRHDGIEGDYLIEAIQDIVIPYDILMLRSAERMQNALIKITDLKQDLLPFLYAHDPHYLRLAHEASSLITMAEIALQAGLERKESRANIREDYPCIDNINWLQWILLKRDNGNMKVWREKIPVERYPLKPKSEKIIHPCLEVARKRGLIKEISESGVQWA